MNLGGRGAGTFYVAAADEMGVFFARTGIKLVLAIGIVLTNIFVVTCGVTPLHLYPTFLLMSCLMGRLYTWQGGHVLAKLLTRARTRVRAGVRA